ncbi:hypothetical protein GXP70_02495 [Paenibacillus lycopersici]|uniref:Uncharacterized protein n=1 Tax=Paenibacillus lycopersici TaxID=2704462 RepID=A0A6C0FP94_9BACL|nr:hypothetical protein [Paenibacillus lycopersici]QHT58938.1 hypothetical protein GXP70_02495 [Paenibacillus lycopersici]
MMRHNEGAARAVAAIGAAALMLLGGCASEEERSHSPETVRQQDAAAATTDEAASHEGVSGMTITDDATASEAKVEHDPEPTNREPDASLPEKGIYLYTDSEGNAQLQIGELRQQMDWTYKTPRNVMPVLQAQDYDGDGQEELAAVLDLGSGTGISLYELHVVEYRGVDMPAGQQVLDHRFVPEDYLNQLEKAIQFKKTSRNGELFGQLTLDGQPHEVSLKAYQADFGADHIQDRLGYGNVVMFTADRQGLQLIAAVGVAVEGVLEPQYIGEIKANVTYAAGGEFLLDQFGFTAYVPRSSDS